MINNVLNADFTSKNTFEEKANYSEIVFGLNRPLLTPELNELQSILKAHRTNIIDNIFGSGILGVGTINFSGGTLTVRNEKAIVKGELINITSQNIALSEGNDVYLTASYVEKTGSDTIKEYGNTQSSTNVTNRIEDENYGETSRRKQLVFNLSKVSVSNALNLKLGRISGGKFIQECDTIANNLAKNIVASKLSIKDAENLFNATNVEDALIEIMRSVKAFNKTVEGSFISENNTIDSFLQNIEIKGNTIQNPNDLSDIKSVGNLIADVAYKIPIICTGKNIFDEQLEYGGIDGLTGKLIPGDNTIRSKNFIKVPTSKKITISRDKQNGAFGLRLYDKSKNYIGMGDSTTSLVLITTFNDNVGYIKFIDLSHDLTTKYQIEEGNNATPKYEPYQEYKLNILSPVQLDKIGDIADRIIEKDGVWGIEKYFYDWTYDGTTEILKGSESPSGLYGITINKPNNDNMPSMCNFFPYSKNYNSDTQCFYNQGTNIVFLLEEDITLQEFKNRYANKLYIKLGYDEPQFIPLPDDQQIKLKSFNGKTNIDFLTEVEGTIKADVPISLGASVESNTQAIDVLNKEVESIKRLKEATSLNITTNKRNFTCEDTIQGRIDNIKLKGKTLVNLITTNTTDSIVLNSTKRTADFNLLSTIPSNTDIRIFINITSRSVGNHPVKINFIDSNNQNHYYELTWGVYNQIIDFKLNHDCKKITIYLTSEAFTDNPNAKIHFKDLAVTNSLSANNYFTGMKSVGDDVEDIEMVSMSKDLKEVVRETNESTKVQIQVSRFYQSCFVYNPLDKEIRLGINNNSDWVRDIIIPKYTVTPFTLKGGEFIANIIGYVNAKHSNAKDLYKVKLFEKCDINKALYYDPETKSWKKPILRERDTIEKHSDSKYYYHKRDNIRTFKGSSDENWVIADGGSSLKLFELVIDDMVVNDNNANILTICDKLTSVTSDYHWFNDGNMITVGLSTKAIRIKVVGVNTLDGIKQWLQNNPITVEYPLANEKVYECTSLEADIYDGETNFTILSGSITPQEISFSMSGNIGNLVKFMQEDISHLEDVSANTLLELISHNHDDRYFKVYNGEVSDFNTAKEQGIYHVSGDFPNAPSTGKLYGVLEVLARDLHRTQRFTDIYNNVWIRFFNSGSNSWTPWKKQASLEECDSRYFRTNMGNVTDFNTATNWGIYRVSSGTSITNAPYTGAIYGNLEVLVFNNNSASGEYIQRFTDSQNNVYVRFRNNNNNVWSNWSKMFTSTNKPTWNDITGKPNTFTPSSHDHDNRYYTESESDSRFLGKNDKVEWNNVVNKPSTFAPSTHDHDNRVNKVPQRLSASTNLNTVCTGGNYLVVPNTPNSPDSSKYGRLVVLQWDSSAKWCTQVFYVDGTNLIYTRCSTNDSATSWTPWAKVYSEANKPSWNDVTGKPSSFTPSSHDHDSRYYTESESDERFFRNYVGDVTDFNTATTIGRYYVYKDNGSIPNAPFSGNAYGVLEVMRTNNSEIIQRFTGMDGKIYVRLRNYANKWNEWNRLTIAQEFACMNSKSSGYQRLPGGMLIQWGTTLVNFTSNKGNGYLNYPIAFTQSCIAMGNVGTNDYGGYAETSATVQGDSLTRAYAEVINVGGTDVSGKQARINWIAIGI